jgi:hypothetical protein
VCVRVYERKRERESEMYNLLVVGENPGLPFSFGFLPAIVSKRKKKKIGRRKSF